MIVTSRGSVFGLLRWQWKWVSVYTAAAAAIAAADHFLPFPELLRLPTLPLVVVGGALGIFVSFRTNAAYDRWWEGRKLWGRLINSSRHFVSQVLSYLPAAAGGGPSELQRRLVYRHIAYVHALRCALRLQDSCADGEFRRTLPDAMEPLAGQSNLNHALLARQLDELTGLTNQQGELDGLRLQSFDQTLAGLLDIQGGCERIKKTPMPRGYGFIATRLIIVYSLLFPLALVSELSWLTIPINVMVCLSLGLISEAGRVLEDPFSLFWNGLPLSQLSRMIEVNLRERLGETELPPMLEPNAKGVLM